MGDGNSRGGHQAESGCLRAWLGANDGEPSPSFCEGKFLKTLHDLRDSVRTDHAQYVERG